MKDLLGIPISIGDTIVCKYVCTTSTGVAYGTVEGFTPQRVKVKLIKPYSCTELKVPDECVVITQQQAYNLDTYPELFI